MPDSRWSTRFARWGSLFLALLAVARAGAAPIEVPNYVLRSWQTEDGLPQTAVTSVTQTREGYMWIGTYSGLARFDGIHFEVFNSASTPELRSGRVTSLLEDANGTLWIGGETGELTRYDLDGRFHIIPVDTKWGRQKVIGLAFDVTGDLWLANPEAMLMRVRDGVTLTPHSGHASNLANLTSDGHGHIWDLFNGSLSEFTLNGLVIRSYTNEANEYVQGVCPSSQGGLWVASEGHLLRDKDGVVQDLGDSPWKSVPLTQFIETREGLLVAGTQDHGVYIASPGGATVNFNRANELPTDWITSLCEDREGNIWAGSGGNGLIMIRPSGATSVNPPDFWQGRPVLSVTSGRDGLWIGTEGAGIYRQADGGWRHFGQEAGIGNLFVWSVCEDTRGQLWAGTWGSGLLRLEGDRFEAAPGLQGMNTPVTALLATGPGQLWVGTGSGLLRYENGPAQWYRAAGAQKLSDVRCVALDKNGTVWFGMLGGGLGCLSNNEARVFRKADGLCCDYLLCLRAAPDGSLWIGSFGGGLSRLRNGHFSNIGTGQGLVDNVICDIEDDGAGNYWLSSHSGIMRVSQAELNQCADGQRATVNCLDVAKSDGLPTSECSGGLQPAGCATPNNRLWFATSKGLAAIDPKAVKSNPLPPPVVIEQLRVDGQIFTNAPPNAQLAQLRIPPGRHRLEFDYTGLSFTSPEQVRFRYKLTGLDADWTDAGSKRTAVYNYAPPEHYEFHVQACNNSGVWNETGASVSFAVLPFFWQTWWFDAGLGALALAVVAVAVWLDTRRRMRGKMETLERQQAVEHERSRIARDIHDELGSHLTRITMLSEPARHDSDANDRGPADVNQIYTIARQLTHTMDEIVWAVNPEHDSLEGLLSYLEKQALDFLGAAGIRCRLDLPMQLPDWPLTADARHNLFLAFKEALHNVVKHSHATEVRVALNLDSTTFTLSVEDNGRGFDPRAVDSSGNGLNNMRRRLENIGGHAELISAPGQGARVIFHMPATEPQTNGAPHRRQVS